MTLVNTVANFSGSVKTGAIMRVSTVLDRLDTSFTTSNSVGSVTDLHLLDDIAHVSGTEVRGDWPVVRFTLVYTFCTGWPFLTVPYSLSLVSFRHGMQTTWKGVN